MKLRVLASGSNGNCYVIESDKEVLLIECGISYSKIKKGLNFNVSNVVGCVISHEHKDHALSANELSNITKVFKPYENVGDVQRVQLGNFKIKTFPLVHSVKCYGFLISHPLIGNLFYASDTEFVKYRFSGESAINHMIIEANYDMELVNTDIANFAHVLTGHMSIETCKEFVRYNNNMGLRNIILCHLSAANADSRLFKKQVKEVTSSNVLVAKSGLIVELSNKPI